MKSLAISTASEVAKAIYPLRLTRSIVCRPPVRTPICRRQLTPASPPPGDVPPARFGTESSSGSFKDEAVAHDAYFQTIVYRAALLKPTLVAPSPSASPARHSPQRSAHPSVRNAPFCLPLPPQLHFTRTRTSRPQYSTPNASIHRQTPHGRHHTEGRVVGDWHGLDTFPAQSARGRFLSSPHLTWDPHGVSWPFVPPERARRQTAPRWAAHEQRLRKAVSESVELTQYLSLTLERATPRPPRPLRCPSRQRSRSTSRTNESTPHRRPRYVSAPYRPPPSIRSRRRKAHPAAGRATERSGCSASASPLVADSRPTSTPRSPSCQSRTSA